jgi:hypothetical protein
MAELLDLPTLDGAGSIEYPLLSPPVPALSMFLNRLKAEEAETYRDWLIATEQGRSADVMPVFKQAGLAQASDEADELDTLAEFILVGKLTT